MSGNNRRRFLKTGAVAAVAAAGTAATAEAQEKPVKKVLWGKDGPPKNPLFSPAVQFGSLLFISGIGAHFPGDITSHTEHVLAEIKNQLEAAGSSMDKVLKCSVFLNDIKDWEAMNKVFIGKWGPEPPVRTTIAPAGGIPGNSLVEMDVIAYV
jgi:2-iminobutanoate/2-iminopropanoate deaminase